MGRDLFFNYLRSTDQLVRPRKKYVVTTQSSHRFRVYNNLLEGYRLTGSHQAWVSDITYLRTYHGFCYLALITDAWSRKIVGYDVSFNGALWMFESTKNGHKTAACLLSTDSPL